MFFREHFKEDKVFILIKNYFTSVSNFIGGYINRGHERSVKAKKNIVTSFFVKGCSVLISIVLVPLTIGYVDPERYGIWLALSSIVGWISFFDIGFTQGLRNKFAESKAKGNDKLLRSYVSTTYFYVAVIFSALWLICFTVNIYIDWDEILNMPRSVEKEISDLAIIILSYFCLQFILRIINTILIADQKPALASLLDMMGQLIALIVVYLLTKFTNGSLIYLGLAIGIPNLLILLIATYFLFKKDYNLYRPNFSLVKKEFAKDIFQIGIKFFVLQIASVVQYESILFLIAHYFDPTQVTAYNIAYKYFFSLQMIFMILLSPLWTGVTDAYTSGDFKWVRNMVKKYLYILILFVVTGIIMFIYANDVYQLWLGKNMIVIEQNISLLCLIFFSTGMFASIFVNVLNGIGALKIQFISSIITSAFFFMLCLTFIKKFHMGVESILISSILANVYGYVIAPIQYYKIFIEKSKASIWYK